MAVDEQVRDAEANTPYREALTMNYPLVERVIQSVARRHRLRADATDELGSIVRLKLVENDYAVLRKYEGRSSLATYLTTVISRIYLDWRTAEWGRWRTSAQARRLGETAQRLERLTHRDGLTFDEALEVLRTNFGEAAARRELESIYEALPHRLRRRTIGASRLETLAAPARESTDENDRLYEQLTRSVAALDVTDRQLLHLRYVKGWTVARIANELSLNARKTYRRLARTIAILRVSLSAPEPVLQGRVKSVREMV